MSTKHIKYSWEELLQFEDTLNKLEYKGVKLGGLFANFLYPNFYFNEYSSNYKLLCIQYLKLFLRPIISIHKDPQYSEVDYIFNYTGNTSKLTGFFIPLLRYITKKNILFVSRNGHQFEDDLDTNFYSLSRLNLLELIKWRYEFKATFSKFEQLKEELKSKYNVDKKLFLHLKIILTLQTQHLFKFEKLLSQVKPKIVLTDHDRQMLNSALIIGAKIKGIRTYTFIHGSTDPEADFIPLLADYMLCWGDKQFKQFSKHGVDKSRLLIVGNPKFERPKLEAQPKFIASQNRLITLITNPIEINEKIMLADKFAEAVFELQKMDSTIEMAIKIHPSENEDDYSAVKHKFPQLTIFSSKNISNEELFSRYNLFVSHNSTMAFDALIHHKKVIIFNPEGISFPLGIGEELHKFAGCKLANTTAQLIESIKDEINTMDIKIMDINTESYINSYCKYWGQESAEKIFKIISQ